MIKLSLSTEGDITIIVPSKYLDFALKFGPDTPDGVELKDIVEFSKEILLELEAETEYGHNYVEVMLENVIRNAVERECAGIELKND